MRMPLATASAVKNSFSFSEPSHQKTWSGSQSFVFSSTHASRAGLAVLQFPKVSVVIVILLPEPKPKRWIFLLKYIHRRHARRFSFRLGSSPFDWTNSGGTGNAISNWKPYESLPINSHVVYTREINHLRRFTRADVGKGG